ncbi:MAG: bifunctional phosphopantothenoylcysteine decarboxylase/phosphopantothenate--cysteine ligase CoaBC, partial [Bacteroidales bacterium]|nr:bifunctional phosphopantothenoylcysteine decarboxylase/phosphopantothenate--cysteine ligase CoaBC [Bacteroidales bacterium]
MLKGKKILIGVTGSIAAYKVPFLVRLLMKEGAEVKVVLTPAARDFVTPLTLSTLSGHPVYSDFFEKEDGTWHSHVDLGNWADVYLIAPVSATTMGKMANGIADNLLTATYLAAKCPVFYAPAMDLDMYKHPTTSANIKKLNEFGNILIEPEEGELASGLYGAGRMQEPEKIIDILTAFFKKKKDFENQHVLISAGPTYES